MSEAHRLLRRARVFGPPPFDPALLAERRVGRPSPVARGRGQARGIHFFCVNASIRSQFEFVQQTWCNNPSFGGLSANKDPIVGDHARVGEPPTRMVIPEAAACIHTAPLPRFVTVRGGAYLFMPSLTALRFLAWARSPDRGEQLRDERPDVETVRPEERQERGIRDRRLGAPTGRHH